MADCLEGVRVTPVKIPAPPTPRHLLGKVRLERPCDEFPYDPEVDEWDRNEWHEPIILWDTFRRDLNKRGAAVSTSWGAAWVMVRCNNPDCSGHAWISLEDIEDMISTMVAKAKNV